MSISEKEIRECLDKNCGRFCFVAYDNFLKEGRGLIALDRKEDGDLNAFYLPLKEVADKDPKDIKMVESYDPTLSFILLFPIGDGKTKTMKIDLPEEHSPKKIYEQLPLTDLMP